MSEYEPIPYPRMLYDISKAQRIVQNAEEEAKANTEGWGDYDRAPEKEKPPLEGLAAVLAALDNKGLVVAYGAEHFGLSLDPRSTRPELEAAVLAAAPKE